MTTITELDGLSTGDIVLFSGRCKVSLFLRLLMLGKWSHVGIIVIDPAYDFPLLYESTHNDKIPGLDLGRPHQGVQMVPFKERLAKYKGDIAIRKLNGVDIKKEDLDELNKLRLSMRGRPFEKSIWQMLKSQFRYTFYHQKEDLSSMFCSELVAQAYIKLGILFDDSPSNAYTPMDFSEREYMQLRRGYLGKEILVKRYKNRLIRK